MGQIEKDGYERQRYGAISQQSRGNLILAPADPLRSNHHRLGHNKTYRQGHITYFDVGHNHKTGIKSEANGSSYQAEEQRTRICALRVGCRASWRWRRVLGSIELWRWVG